MNKQHAQARYLYDALKNDVMSQRELLSNEGQHVAYPGCFFACREETAQVAIETMEGSDEFVWKKSSGWFGRVYTLYVGWCDVFLQKP